MGRGSFLSFLSGYVEIIIRGSQLEKLLNLITGSGFYIWDIRRIGTEILHAKMRVHGFLQIRDLIHKTGAKVKIRRKIGWPFICRKIIRRKMFLLCAILFILILSYLSTFIFVIKVEGFEGQKRNQILQSLAQLGVKPGIRKSDLLHKKAMIERSMMLGNPDTVWLGITIRGVVAEVRAVPRKPIPVSLPMADIVAVQGGVITKLVVIRGFPVVKEGDTVTKGDLLITGTSWNTKRTTGEIIKTEIPASGVVEARTWSEIQAIEPKIVWEPIQQKICYTEYQVRWGGTLWRLAGIGRKPSGDYSFSRWRKRIYQGRNPFGGVELIKDSYQVTTWRRVIRPLEQVKQIASREVQLQIKNLAISSPSQQVESWSEEGNFVKYMVTLETVRDIAMVLPRGKEH